MSGLQEPETLPVLRADTGTISFSGDGDPIRSMGGVFGATPQTRLPIPTYGVLFPQLYLTNFYDGLQKLVS